MHSIFKLRTTATEEIISLLESVTLGTDGAHYRHLDTRERILEADNPLFLSMERHEKPLGTITFCQREKNWYIRYFAFDKALQANGVKKSRSEGLLKRELNAFFDEKLKAGEVDAFYAYIDPRNVKSLWMSENFGFKTIGKIATQTYSTTRKPKKGRVKLEMNPICIPKEVKERFETQIFYFEEQLQKGNHFSICDIDGNLIAFAKTTAAHWEIKRLPGNLGGFLVKIIPFIPFLNRLIKPKDHAFIVPEAVFVKDNDPQLVTELFDGILAHTNQRVIFWWVDETDELYTSIRSKFNWGLLHKLVGINHANLVVRSNSIDSLDQASYSSGFDFV